MFFLKKFYYYPFVKDGDEVPPNPPAPNPNPTPKDDPSLNIGITNEELLEYKKNHVKKADFDALNEKYRELVKGVLDGGDLNLPNGEEQSPDIAKLRKELYSPESNLSNLEYVSKTLQLREAIMKEGKPDPFLSPGIKETPSAEDALKAQKVASTLAEMVKTANGSAETFDIILSQKII